MVLYDPSDGYIPVGGSGGDGGEQVPPGQAGGCSPGEVFSELDENGNWIGNVAGTQGKCIPAAEAERRRNIPTSQATGGSSGGGGSVGSGGPMPAAGPNYGKAPVFNYPDFTFGEQWNAPTMADAQNDPGYQFALNEGEKALQYSAAAKGHLLTGGTLKDITKWGGDYANQRYGDVFNRALTSYSTRFGTAKDIYDRNEALAKDKFGPTFQEWLQKAHGIDLGWQQSWTNYWKNNLSAQDVFANGN